jgi:hypothetical protein
MRRRLKNIHTSVSATTGYTRYQSHLLQLRINCTFRKGQRNCTPELRNNYRKLHHEDPHTGRNAHWVHTTKFRLHPSGIKGTLRNGQSSCSPITTNILQEAPLVRQRSNCLHTAQNFISFTN